jgi:hypothetical protein
LNDPDKAVSNRIIFSDTIVVSNQALQWAHIAFITNILSKNVRDYARVSGVLKSA